MVYMMDETFREYVNFARSQRPEIDTKRCCDVVGGSEIRVKQVQCSEWYQSPVCQRRAKTYPLIVKPISLLNSDRTSHVTAPHTSKCVNGAHYI
jgi:hypothetical protein